MTVERITRQPLENEIKKILHDGIKIVEKAVFLSDEDFEEMAHYIINGGTPLALVAAQKFFELYLNGYDVKEINRLNPTFTKGAILLAKVRYDWDKMYDDAMQEMNRRIINKMNKAAVEATSIYTDMIAAANKNHGDKLKKYLQTGDEKYLEDSITINSIKDLATVIDSLQKLSGADKVMVIKDERSSMQTANQNLALPVNKKDVTLEIDATKQILNILAEEKRRKARGENG